MVRRRLARAFVGLVVGLGLAACASSPAAPSPAASFPPSSPQPPAATATLAKIELQDGGGETVVLASPAVRVVSLAPSNTEILYAVGAGSQTIGRDEFSDFPARAKTLPAISTGMGKLNTEAVLALQPDLVLAADIISPEQVQSLRALNLTVFVLRNPTDFDGLYRNILAVGTLTGHATEAAQLVASLSARVGAVEAKVQAAANRPKVFYELDATDPTKPWTTGPGTFLDLLIRTAGGQSASAGLTAAFAQISSEELVRQNPDLIILGDSAYGTTVDSVRARPGWQTVTAVNSAAIYPFDDNLVSRPGPRLVDGLEALARLIHPEVFK